MKYRRYQLYYVIYRLQKMFKKIKLSDSTIYKRLKMFYEEKNFAFHHIQHT